MKKKILYAAAVAFCIAIATSGTLAYFSSEDTAHNIITSSNMNIKVVEKTRNEDGSLVDFPKEGIKGVMPGADISKIVTVDNTGESEAWVRVKVESTITSAEGTELPADVMDYKVNAGWLPNDDGYIYYADPVTPKEATDILFDTVHLDPEMGNEYQNCTANILISAQAVQTAHNGATVLDAKGWPAEE